MRIFHGFDALPRFEHPAATVGSYDGVHTGHRALLSAVADAARAQGGESVVFTFEPHPRVTLGKAEGLRLLTSLEEKACLLAGAGVDNLVVIPFDRSFSRLSADEFIGGMLVGRAGIETLVVGFNHRFGRDKQGSYDYLGSHAFGLRVVEVAECDVDERKVSSTVVRNLIAAGDMAGAARMLAHPYLLIGEAEAGRIRIGEPLKLLPPPGEYAVRIRPLPPQADARTGIVETPAAGTAMQAAQTGFIPVCGENTPAASVAKSARRGIPDVFQDVDHSGSASGTMQPEISSAPPLAKWPEPAEGAGSFAARLEVGAAQELLIRDGCPPGRVAITF